MSDKLDPSDLLEIIQFLIGLSRGEQSVEGSPELHPADPEADQEEPEEHKDIKTEVA